MSDEGIFFGRILVLISCGGLVANHQLLSKNFKEVLMAKTGALCTRLLVVLEHVVVVTETFIDLLGLRIMRLTNSSLKPSVVVVTILEILLVKLTNR